MKTNIGIILFICLLLTSCSPVSNNMLVSKPDAVSNQAAGIKHSIPNVQIGEELMPLVTEKINTSQKGIKMTHMMFPTEMSKGEDGSCYYLRVKGDDKEQVVTFYRNNGIRVCETQIYKVDRLWKDHYSITKFLQYKDYFYVALISDYESGIALLKVDMVTGKSTLLGKKYNFFNDLLFYEDHFYDTYNENLIQYDLQGKKISTIKLNKDLAGNETRALCIVDGKIYYGIFETESLNVKIGRCDLKGDRHELLFTYKADGVRATKDMLMFAGDYMYIVGEFGDKILKQIPLYGGKVEGFVETKNTSYSHFKFSAFAITEQEIFYLDAKNHVYQMDKSKSSKPMLVSSTPSSQIVYADGHLMLEKCNKDEDKVIDVINEMECPISKNYAHAYDWITEKGEVEYRIEGSGLSKKDLEYYEERERWE